jgi:hypothetical protein
LEQGDYAQSAALSEEALMLYRAQGDKRGIATVLSDLSSVVDRRGDYARAAALCE